MNRLSSWPLDMSISPYQLTDDEISLLLEHFMGQWEVENE